jgi:predicted RNA-binding Zn-ribbon protein involved in translation (DUF1610 family)
MECPACKREIEVTVFEWAAVECPWCGTVWIGGDEEAPRVLVPPRTA